MEDGVQHSQESRYRHKFLTVHSHRADGHRSGEPERMDEKRKKTPFLFYVCFLCLCDKHILPVILEINPEPIWLIHRLEYKEGTPKHYPGQSLWRRYNILSLHIPIALIAGSGT